MNVLVDAQLPPRLCDWLAEWVHAARHVADIGMVGASDVEIAEPAKRERLILVSKDEDFIYLRLPDRFTLV